MSPALLAALIAVESGGRDHVVGDGGRAVGCLQVHAGVVADVNARYGTHYRWSGMTNRTDAVAVCDRYLRLYATEKRLGRPVTDQDRARIWNGGPNGWRSHATVGYWRRVESKMP